MNGQDGTGNGRRETCDTGGEASLAHAISGDGHQFLQHMLSLEGEELQKLLSGMGSCDPSVFWGTDDAVPQQQGTGDPLLRLTSDGAMLSELMHVLGGDSMRDSEDQGGTKIVAEDAQEKAKRKDEKVGHDSVHDIMAQNAPLFSEKTMNMILGEQLRNIAAEYKCDSNGIDRSQEAKEKAGPSKSSIFETGIQKTAQEHVYELPWHQINNIQDSSHAKLNEENVCGTCIEVSGTRLNLAQELLQTHTGGSLHGNQFVNQIQEGYVGPTSDQSTSKQQYITLLDGRILQRSDGSAVVATLPKGQVRLTVPIPGSSSVLQYVPVLDSAIVPHPVGIQGNNKVQAQLNISKEPSHGFAQHAVTNSSAHLSVSATDQLVEAAALQHRMLTEKRSVSADVRHEGSKMEPCMTNSVHQKLKPKLVPLFSPNASSGVPIELETKALDGQSILESLPSSTSEIGISRKTSHKRERSLATADLLASEQLHAPQLKQANANSLASEKPERSLPNLESNRNIKDSSYNESRRDDSVQQNNLPSPTETECPIYVADLGNVTDASLPRLLKYYKQEIEIDEETSKLIESTLSVPEGTKRRGRPPGKSKNSFCNIPGYTEPTDSEILATLLTEDPSRKLIPPEELKKLVRKEKNRISAAFSRIKSEYETKKLEGEIQQLEAECIALSEWLNSSVTSSPDVLPHRLLISNGQSISIEDPSEVIKPLVRHLSL